MDFFQSIYNWWWWWSADTMRHLMFPHFNVFRKNLFSCNWSQLSVRKTHMWWTNYKVSVNIPWLYIYILYVFPSLCSLKAKCFHIHWYWTLTSGSLLVLSCLCWQDTEGQTSALNVTDRRWNCFTCYEPLKLFSSSHCHDSVTTCSSCNQAFILDSTVHLYFSHRPDTSCLCCVLSVDCLIIKLI